MIPLEHLADGSVAARNFDTIARLSIDTGGQSVRVRFGTATLSFTASTDSADATVPHGLGTTPVAVVATSLSAASYATIPSCNVHTFTSSTFKVNGRIASSTTGDRTICWIAFG